jgi:hypothetical protein
MTLRKNLSETKGLCHIKQFFGDRWSKMGKMQQKSGKNISFWGFGIRFW